ncbi:MAG TPA: hypothetical protein VFQ87_11300 [Bradyrhizobium sp.]|jgi:hypothetical protein|nr:hypothetical protein [Bradyrhizobium sp.]
MQGWIGAATLMVFAVAGSAATIDRASAAKVITVPRSHVHAARYPTYRPYGEPYYAGGAYYIARPFFYIPAPFPLGVDFGFGW